MAYYHLVLACGQAANLAIVKGMARYALPLKTLGDALFLRNRAIVRLEQAELQRDPAVQTIVPPEMTAPLSARRPFR